jgi:hypothetical protein
MYMHKIPRALPPHRTVLRLLVLAVGLGAIGCSEAAVVAPPDLPQEGRIRVQNDEATLRRRVHVVTDTLAIEPVGSVASVRGAAGAEPAFPCPPPAFSLVLVAQVDPPELNGVRLQASHVVIRGSKAYVAYNVQGPLRKGGVDVFDVNHPEAVELTSSALFTDTDVSAADEHGSSALYLATATDDATFATPAVLEVVDLEGGKLTSSSRRVDLPSFAGTGVRVQGDAVYVTSGSGGDPVGGLSVFERATLEPTAFDAFEDARAVDVQGDLVVAMRGTPGALRVYDGAGMDFVRSIASGGAGIPESKGTVFIARHYAFYAAGDGGLRVVDLATDATVVTLAVPDVAGLVPEDDVTNGASASGNLVFIANGGAGLYVAQSSLDLDAENGGGDFTLELVGHVRFPGDESANYVASRGNLLFVANGLGGLSIVRIDH